MKKIIVHKTTGKPLQLIETSIGSAFVPDEGAVVEEVDPDAFGVHLHLPRLTVPQWCSIVGFFRWGQEEFGSEVQVCGFLHPEKGWRVEALPQLACGMTTREVEGPEREAVFEGIAADGWPVEVTMTAHHHCKAGAFQSGTDSDDEFKKKHQGAHITLGNLDRETWSYHGRAKLSLMGTFGPGGELLTPGVSAEGRFPLRQLVEVPGVSDGMWHELVDLMADYYLLSPERLPSLDFPEEWKGRVSKPAAPAQRGYTYGHYHNAAAVEEDRVPLSVGYGMDILTAAVRLSASGESVGKLYQLKSAGSDVNVTHKDKEDIGVDCAEIPLLIGLIHWLRGVAPHLAGAAWKEMDDLLAEYIEEQSEDMQVHYWAGHDDVQVKDSLMDAMPKELLAHPKLGAHIVERVDAIVGELSEFYASDYYDDLKGGAGTEVAKG